MSDERAVSFDDPVFQRGFTQIPNVLLRDASLSLPARATYAMLASFAWESDSCYPGQKRVAEMLAVSERSLREYLNELANAGWLAVKQRGLGQTNVYRLLVPDRKQTAGLTGSRLPDRIGGGLPTKNTKVEEDEVEEENSGSASPPTQQDEVRQVWSHYESLFGAGRGKGLTDSKRRIITTALKEYDVADLCLALDGLKRHREGPGKGRSTDIAAALKTNPNSGPLHEHIGFWIKQAEQSKPAAPSSERQADVLDDEWRRANGLED